ncbi:MAG: carboxypeptidase regulatory-like domain-containing protein, partial [Acidobacteriota bacterium]|nr:carboxypeptidase regulatory-like domain-containing protein [Acidobacteriota bacterium]
MLNLSLDASQIAASDQKQQKVRIAVQQGGAVKSQIVSVEGGKASARFEVNPKQSAQVAVGPESAGDEDIFHLQTLTVNVTPQQWAGAEALNLPALVVTPRWWTLWLVWCRDFTISGRVVCADGSPVPGAEVHAYDVDFFWWWSSITQVGPTAVTDASGHFTIKFRWCCYWWPWWWWRLRYWRLDPLLIDRIRPVLALNPAIHVPEPDPEPSLDWVAHIPQAVVPHPGGEVPAHPILEPALAVSRRLEPSLLPAYRGRLLSVLPHVPELERLRLWPWFPWAPWFDCSPDIIFKVTQSCGGGPAKVIVNENIFQTRWDIPTTLNVTLVANRDACCVPHEPPPPEGDCVVLTGVCGDPGIPITSIGHTGATAGYADPGGRDRPFSEAVYVSGQFGTSAQADFYGIEYTPHGVSAWAPLPLPAMQAM